MDNHQKAQNQKNDNQQQDQPMDILRPSDKEQTIKQPKKRHRFRNFLIVLIIIVLVIIIGLGVTGIYNIPGVSSVFGMNKPKDLGVKTSPEALASLKEKIPMTISGESTNYSSGAEGIFTGEIPVDAQITAEEATSWIQRHQRSDPIFSDIHIKHIEGGMEISAMTNRYVKAPVYARAMIDLIDSNTVAIDIQSGKLGIFSVPDRYLDQAEDFIEEKVNSLINRVPGFSIEIYELHDGYSKFKGTFPANVKPSPLGWSDMLNY